MNKSHNDNQHNTSVEALIIAAPKNKVTKWWKSVTVKTRLTVKN